MPMKKTERQGIIKRLINDNEIETQDELLALLKEEGVVATQATISRDIRDLNVIKKHRPDGTVRYEIYKQNQIVSEDKLKEKFKDSVLKITQVQFMTIISTTLGAADVVSALMDDLKLPEIVATLAGVDTIIVISENDVIARALSKKLTSYLNEY